MADNAILDTKEKLYNAADLLRQSADKIADNRTHAFEAGELSFEEFRFNVSREGLLRNDVAELIVKAINAGIDGVAGAQKDLESAIAKANRVIARIDNIKKALGAFAAIIGLAAAIVRGEPTGILDALKGVKEASA
jgi:hypothetical protein